MSKLDPEFGDVIVGRSDDALFCLGSDGTDFLNVRYMKIKRPAAKELQESLTLPRDVVIGGGFCEVETWNRWTRSGSWK